MSANGHRSFDEVRSPRIGRAKGCPRCGAPTNAGSVSVQLAELKSTGGMGNRVNSRAKSLCEPCSIEVYELLVDALLGHVERSETAA